MAAIAQVRNVSIPDLDALLYAWRLRPLNENDFGLLVRSILWVIAAALPRMEGAGSLLHHARRRLPKEVELQEIRDVVALPIAFPATRQASPDAAIGYFLIATPEGVRFMALEYPSSTDTAHARLVPLEELGFLARMDRAGITRNEVVRLLHRQLLNAAACAEESQLMRAAVLALIDLGRKICAIFAAKGLQW